MTVTSRRHSQGPVTRRRWTGRGQSDWPWTVRLAAGSQTGRGQSDWRRAVRGSDRHSAELTILPASVDGEWAEGVLTSEGG